MRSLLVAVALFSGCAASLPPGKPAAVGAPVQLPSVTLATLDGRGARLDQAIAGRPALVTLWATWCEACVDELGALARLDARLAQDKRAIVVGVAVGEERAKVADFVARRRLAWTQLVDESFQLTDALGEKRVPTTLVIDRAGRIVYSGGALDEAALRALEQVMQGDGGARLVSSRNDP